MDLDTAGVDEALLRPGRSDEAAVDEDLAGSSASEGTSGENAIARIAGASHGATNERGIFIVLHSMKRFWRRGLSEAKRSFIARLGHIQREHAGVSWRLLGRQACRFGLLMVRNLGIGR